MRGRFGAATIGIIVGLLIFALWLSQRESQPTGEQPDAGASPSPTRGYSTGTPSPSGTVAPVAPTSPSTAPATATATAAPFVPPDEAAKIEVDKVGLMIRDYHKLAKENPVGTNAEIMAAIMGGNRTGATLGPPEGMTLNENGELIDRWGTPYFFHQLSGDEMEIRSAGADKVMWTDDDAVTR